MPSPGSPYRIFPLGDSAITIEFGNRIDEQINKEVIARFLEWKDQPLTGQKELVPAYSSLTVYYDKAILKIKNTGHASAYERISEEAITRLQQPSRFAQAEGRRIEIPVCYESEFAPDLQRIAGARNITAEEVITIHSSNEYKVYMMGFLPGFAYMGEVDERIAVPRKPQPVPIPAGSVAIAGKQTGIYPLNSPGGWQVIGRTPIRLFDATKEKPILLEAGDRVRFYPINQNEFIEIQNSQEGRL